MRDLRAELQLARHKVIEAEQALVAAQTALSDLGTELVGLATEPGIVAFVYWDCGDCVVPSALAEKLDVSAHQLRAMAGPVDVPLNCSKHGGFVVQAHSRAEREALQRRFSSHVRKAECPQCRDERESGRLRRQQLQTMPYWQYLQTPEWSARRAAMLEAADYRCQLCSGAEPPLDVHHNTYERRGWENDKDLIVLCRTCHAKHHDKLKTDRPAAEQWD